MELEGLKRSVAYLQGQGLTIGVIITDRHPSVQKWLREHHKEIKHYYDVWHIAKGMCITFDVFIHRIKVQNIDTIPPVIAFLKGCC